MIAVTMRNSAVFCIAMSLVLLSGCEWFGTKQAATQPYLVVVDVLDPELYNNCTIAGAINVPFAKVEQYAQQHWEKDKEKIHIVLFCANYKCSASGQAAAQLQKLGYQHVWAYEGGTAEWRQLGFKTYGACDPAKSGYLSDTEKPAGAQTHAPTITAQELKAMIEKFENQGQFRK